MKKRIISAAILVPILFLLTLAAPVIAASLVMSALMAIAAYELLYRTGLVKRPRLVIYSCIMAAAVCMWSYFGAIHSYFVILMIVFFILMFSEMMLDHIKVHFEDLSMCFVAGLLIPYMLSSLIRILNMDLGRYVILIPFVVAFMSDAGAYFIGLKFGGHKLAPVSAPTKPSRARWAGIAFAVVSMLVYALIIDLLPGNLRSTTVLRCCTASPVPCWAFSATCASPSSSGDRHQGLRQSDSRPRQAYWIGSIL